MSLDAPSAGCDPGSPGRHAGRRRITAHRRALAALAAAIGLLAAHSPAAAQAESAWWRLSSQARPSYLPREQGAGRREIVINAEDTGNAPVTGSPNPVQITDTLPAGLSVDQTQPSSSQVAGAITYAGSRQSLPCTVTSADSVSCALTGTLVPYGQIEIRIAVTVEERARSGALNEVSVTGGGAPPATIKAPVTIVANEQADPTPFGAESYTLAEEDEGGAIATQAAQHPFQQTTSLVLNQTADTGSVGEAPDARPASPARELISSWPAGVLLQTPGLSTCASEQFLQTSGEEDACPPETAVGVVTATVSEPLGGQTATYTVPLFNLAPQPGGQTRLGFDIPQAAAPFYIDTALRNGHDYGITATSAELTRSAPLLSAALTLWGVPGAAAHDAQRGWGCLLRAREAHPGSGELTNAPCSPGQSTPQPLLRLPAACDEGAQSTLEGDAWSAPTPGSYAPLAVDPQPRLLGCNRPQFAPTLTAFPDQGQAMTPTGFTIALHSPQEASENPNGLADSDIKDIVLTLPAGVTLNPAWANGLAACSEAQIGYLPAQSTPPLLQFTSALPTPLSPGVNFCPDASRIGTASIRTPLLASPLSGAVYLAAPQSLAAFPQENPFGAALAMYIEASDPAHGTVLKLAGRVELGEEGADDGLAPGQIRGVFEDLPQVDFEDAELHLFGGEGAALTTPAACGTYATQATFTPWSGTPPVTASSSFRIASGAGGGPCPAAAGFAPTLAVAGQPLSAGSQTGLSLTLARADTDRPLRSIQLRLPAGLAVELAGIAPCPQTQAAEGACGPASLLGHVSAAIGLGAQPLALNGGIYLTEGYDGAPLGLAITVPAQLGPFALGTINVRGALQLDPRTGQATIATEPIPRMLGGFPLDIQRLNLTFDRPGFATAPTSCAPNGITGSLASFEGPAAPVSASVAVVNCAAQGFAPARRLSGRLSASRTLGDALSLRLADRVGGSSAQAYIGAIELRLPKQLQLRAGGPGDSCPAASFEADPDGCPAAAAVGRAVLHTPLLPVAMQGPVVRLSRPGQSAPGFGVVLHGYGITRELLAETSTSRGLASIQFTSLPDEPLGSLELTLAQGATSALLPTASPCTATLTVPSILIAENDAELRQNTPLSLAGCARHAGPSRAQLLAKALKACRKQRRSSRRLRCERAARRRYGPAPRERHGRRAASRTSRHAREHPHR